MNAKPWYASKTIWTNLLALGAIGFQAYADSAVLDPAIQAGILAVVNAALRLCTAQPVK